MVQGGTEHIGERMNAPIGGIPSKLETEERPLGEWYGHVHVKQNVMHGRSMLSRKTLRSYEWHTYMHTHMSSGISPRISTGEEQRGEPPQRT